MSSDASQFLRRATLVFGSIIAGTVGFNIAVNAYDVFPVPTITGFNDVKHGIDRHSRIAKPYAVMKVRPQWVILGTSRAESAFDPLHSHFQGFNAYNLAFPGGRMYEEFRYLQHATASGRLKRVTIALDFQQFLAESQKVSADFDDGRLAVSADGLPQSFPWRDVVWLASSGAAFGESWSSFKRRHQPSIYRADGYRIDTGDIPPMLAKKGGQRQEFLDVERGFLRMLRGLGVSVARTNRVDSSSWDDFERLLDWCEKNGLAVEFLIPVVHARLLALIDGAGKTDEIEDWKRRLVARITQRHLPGKCAIWDFSYANAITGEPVPDPKAKSPMVYWRESSHATRAAGEAMLDAMRADAPDPNFGHCLTPTSIEPLLTEQRAALKRWANEQPGAFAEVQATIAQGD